MKNKKRNRKINIFKNILIDMLFLIGVFGTVFLIVPEIYYLFLKIFNVLTSLFGFTLICGGFIGVVVLLGLATKCIERRTEYKFTNTDFLDQNTDLMREQLRVVKTDEKSVEKGETVSKNKFSYLFDNNYQDVEDIEIDDIMNPNWRSQFNYEVIDEYDDSDVKIYTRKK